MISVISKEDESLIDLSRRIFSRAQKDDCWQKATIIPGRDPNRWRLDAVGNIVCYGLKGCEGCLCHEYDHILPWSKGGTTSLDNCQILQTRVNRFKGNDQLEGASLKRFSCAKKFTMEELDLIEMSVWGNVNRDGLKCHCKSIMELMGEFRKKSLKLPNCP